MSFELAFNPRWRVRARASRGLRFNEVPGIQIGLVCTGTAVATAYAVTENKLLALVLSALPLAAWLLTRRRLLFLLLGASLPALGSLTGGGHGQKVALSDIFLLLLGCVILFDATTARPMLTARALRPVALPVLLYCATLAVLFTIHLGASEAAQTGQRYELFLLPLLVGSFAALSNYHVRLLQAYILSTTLLAITWPIDNFGVQKNPVGQLLANAILLLIAVRPLRRLLPCLFVLVPGLFLTESRGAIAAAAIGTAVVVAMLGLRARPILTRVAPIALFALGAFLLMPAALQQRVTTFSAGVNTPAAYSIHIRQQLHADARRIIDLHPWTGAGVGNYLAANSFSAIPSDDPHQVLLLEAAEGGYLLAASFVLLVIGSAFALTRMRNVDVGPAAAAVLIATAAHGLVDVYWVHGTPVLSWLLVGMACGSCLRLKQLEASAQS